MATIERIQDDMATDMSRSLASLSGRLATCRNDAYATLGKIVTAVSTIRPFNANIVR